MRLAASWLVVATLLLQALFSSAMAPLAWAASHDPLALAQAFCLAERPGQGSPKDPGSNRSTAPQDHDQCTLCCSGLIPCPTPTIVLLPAVPRSATTPAPALQIATVRKDVSPGAPRAPPRLA